MKKYFSFTRNQVIFIWPRLEFEIDLILFIINTNRVGTRSLLFKGESSLSTSFLIIIRKTICFEAIFKLKFVSDWPFIISMRFINVDENYLNVKNLKFFLKGKKLFIAQ
jgi:hypothetical protein